MNGKIEVLVKWVKFDEPSWEPLQVINEDDPITLAKYARDRGIESQHAWRWTKRYLNLRKTSQNRLIQLYSKKAKTGPKFKFGEKVPRTVKEAYELDEKNGNR